MDKQIQIEALHIIATLNGNDHDKISIPIAYLHHFTNPHHAFVFKQVCFWWNQKKGDWNYCSHKIMGADFGMNADQVGKTVSYLKKNGYIETRKRMVNGSPTMDYKVIPAKLIEVFDQSADSQVAPPIQSANSQVAVCEIADSITDINNNIDQNHTLNSCPIDQEAQFNRFWYDYPRKDAKIDAWKAFKQVTKGMSYVEMDSLVTACTLDVLRRIDNPDVWENPKYIPLPASYLRGERWKDAPPPAKKTIMTLLTDTTWGDALINPPQNAIPNLPMLPALEH